jgi:hypothetical protein
MAVIIHLNGAEARCRYWFIAGELQSKENVEIWPAAILAEAWQQTADITAGWEETARRIAAGLGISASLAA